MFVPLADNLASYALKWITQVVTSQDKLKDVENVKERWRE